MDVYLTKEDLETLLDAIKISEQNEGLVDSQIILNVDKNGNIKRVQVFGRCYNEYLSTISL